MVNVYSKKIHFHSNFVVSFGLRSESESEGESYSLNVNTAKADAKVTMQMETP